MHQSSSQETMVNPNEKDRKAEPVIATDSERSPNALPDSEPALKELPNIERIGTASGFGNARKAAIAASIIACQFVQMIPYGAGINSALWIGADLGVGADKAVWIAASYPLTQGAFVLMGGRVGAVYGHKKLVVLSGIWWTIFHLIQGFMRNIISLSVMRALAGIGGAFMVPNAIALLTITFPPGKMRNISVGLFGAMAPIGAAGGGIFPGFFGQLTPWKWLFFFLTILGAVIFATFFLIVPPEPEPMDKGGKIDWIGSYLGVTGLILFNFVWNQAPAVTWSEPYIYILLIVSILHIAAFAVWEYHFTSNPILPLSIFVAPSFTPMLIAAFTAFMSVGIVIWYVSVWNLTLRHYTLFGNGGAYAPLAVGGAVAAILSARAVRVMPAQFILAIGSTATLVSAILIATQGVHQTYWAQTFPAVAVLAFGPDFLFTASQIIASASVSRKHQGVAGSLIGTILSYGLSTGLGFAGTVEAYTNSHGQDPVTGYRNALWLAVGMAGGALVLALAVVRIPKEIREGWGDEDEGN